MRLRGRRWRSASKVAMLATGLIACLPETQASSEDRATLETSTESGRAAGATLLLRQIYGGGGLEGAVFRQDFVEILNASAAPQPLEGLSLQIAGSTADFAATPADPAIGRAVLPLPAVIIPPGKTLSIAFGKEPNPVGGEVATDLAQTRTNLPPKEGKVALVRGHEPLGCGGAANRCRPERVVDLVGYGATASDHEGAGPAPAIGPALAIHRAKSGCQDEQDNAKDFTTGRPVPHNLETESDTCGAPPAGQPDGSAPDARPPSEGPRDAGPREAGPREAGPREAGPATHGLGEPDESELPPEIQGAEEPPPSAPGSGKTNKKKPSADSGCSAAPGSTSGSPAEGTVLVALGLGLALARSRGRRKETRAR